MIENYFSISDFLSEEQMIPTIFKNEVNNIDESLLGNKIDIVKGTKLFLPFWLSHPLAQKDLVNIEMPTCFNLNVKESLIACPLNINLKSVNSYFFKFGTLISQIQDDPNFNNVLKNAYKERLNEIWLKVKSKNLAKEEEASFTSCLDESEVKIYTDCSHIFKVLDVWETNKTLN